MMGARSDSISQLAKALAEAQGAMDAPQRTKEAKVFGETKNGKPYEYAYKYAPMEEVVRVVKPPFSAHGLSWWQGMVTEGDRIFVRTTIVHLSGEWFSTDYPVHISKQGAQGFAAGASYARRYGLTFAVGIASEDDDDANVAEGNLAEIATRPAAQPSTRGVTRSAAPQMPPPAPSGAPDNSGKLPRPEWWRTDFFARSSYEIDPVKAGGKSAWETFYIKACENAENYDQLMKLKDDNSEHRVTFKANVNPIVYDNFCRLVKEYEEKKLAGDPELDAFDR